MIDIDDLESVIRKYLKKYGVRCRSITVDEDFVILNAEAHKEDCKKLINELRHLGLQPQNIVYGRWYFTVK